MKFKKIYVEITNVCNMTCSFCHKINRNLEFMKLNKFEKILKKIHGFTNYIYLHVKGEPLLHREIYEFIELAEKYDIKVNITTNGTILNKEILNLASLRQINFSIHSFEGGEREKKKDYILNILNYSILAEKNGKISSLRLWNLNNGNFSKEILETIKFIASFFDKEINFNIINIKKGIKLSKKIFLNFEDVFEWPDLKNDYYEEKGFCYGLKSHIAILVDGTVIPCCLDDEGLIKLGNIFDEDLDEILKNKRTLDILEGFKKRLCTEELCKRCSFKSRF